MFVSLEFNANNTSNLFHRLGQCQCLHQTSLNSDQVSHASLISFLLWKQGTLVPEPMAMPRGIRRAIERGAGHVASRRGAQYVNELWSSRVFLWIRSAWHFIIIRWYFKISRSCAWKKGAKQSNKNWTPDCDVNGPTSWLSSAWFGFAPAPPSS